MIVIIIMLYYHGHDYYANTYYYDHVYGLMLLFSHYYAGHYFMIAYQLPL